MKRIALFIVTNLAVMLVISILLSIFGVAAPGRNLQLGNLLVYSLIVGFAGAGISLLISKPVAKWSTGARVIEQPANGQERWLVSTVQQLAQKAGIGMPEVAIYEGEPNAFATGAFRNSALVAVSTGLLESMNQDEVEAVLAHEVAHIANGDMVTMTLIQGVMNTFVVFLSRVVGYFIDRVILKNEEEQAGIGYTISILVLQLLFGVLASIVVNWFSRQREFRADAGAAKLLGTPQPMVRALQRLGGIETAGLPQNLAAAGIADGPGWMAMFSTHPPIEDRIAALQGR
ncbi:protease HtpX [Massilia sp. W12]|uniref:protease HtpX n=1 Tax=Massilia sp. W12 TaxID=3126507 RepID=UPI0030CC5F25